MFGVPNEQQLALINRLSKRNFEAKDVFVFGGKSAGDRIIEERYIQISKELLDTFVNNAKEGVSWLLNHSWSSWSEPVTIYGRTFDARLQPSSDKNETVELIIDKYIPRSDTIKNGRSANSVIEDIENGVLFDTSIGWGSNKYVCSICNSNYWDCSHWRGNTYEDGDGKPQLCYIIAKNPGYLMEESGVFDGAYKGAGISMCNAGDIFESPQGKFLVIDEFKEVPKDTNVYGIYTSKGQLTTFIKKSDNQKIFAFSNSVDVTLEDVASAETEAPKFNLNNTDEGSDTMGIKELFEKLGIAYDESDTLDKVIEKLSKHWQSDNNQESTPEEFLSKEKATEAFGKEVTADEILKFAKEGIQYHKVTIDNTIALGIKAMGNEFPTETWKSTFSTMGTQSILDIAKTWEAQAKSELKAGQRYSSSDVSSPENEIPDEAYKVK